MSDLLEKAKSLPDEPGIYMFYSDQYELIYVGRATSLKSRVSSYFRGKRLSRPIEDMIHEVKTINWRQAESVLEAVVLEAIYIKKHLPKYNVLGKDNKSWNYIVITKDVYPKIHAIRQHDLKILESSGERIDKLYSHVFGPYPGLNMRAANKVLRRLFQFSVCEPGSSRPCIYFEMGQCYGVCTGLISPAEYKRLVIRPLALFLSGKKRAVIKEFEKRMKTLAKEEHFEEAARVRNQIQSLYHIHDVTLIDKSFFEEGYPEADWVERIEGFDISNLGATDMVGSMVVFDGKEPLKSGYRKFLIRGVVGQSDVDSLAEVLSRRFNHPEWPMPDIVLIDGGRAQVNKIKELFGTRGIEIPFVGIAKGKERKRNDFILGSTDPLFVHWVSKHRNLLIKVRDEAHRFAITFNRSKRKVIR